MNKNLVFAFRLSGLLLMIGVVATATYNHFSAQHFIRQMKSWGNEANAVSDPPTSGNIDLILHDTYYVIASPTYVWVAAVSLLVGLILLFFPYKISKKSQP